MSDAKAYLERVSKAEKELRTLNARLAHYEDLGLSITAHMTDTPVSRSRGSSRVETAAVGTVDTLSAIQAKIRAYTVTVNECEKLIERIPQERYRMLLSLKYLAGMSLRSVGDELRYKDRNSVYRAHGYALLELGHILDEDGIGSDV